MRLKLLAARLLPATLFARMALIVLAGLLSAQLISIWLQSGERASVILQAQGINFVDRIVQAIQTLETTPSTQRFSLIASLQSRELQVAIVPENLVFPFIPHGQIQNLIADKLGSAREIRSPGATGMQKNNPVRIFDVRLQDGQWVRLSALFEQSPPALPRYLWIQLVLTFCVVIAVVIFAVRQAAQPLKQLALAADLLGDDLDASPLAETGPTEVRRAAQAFNRMQGRIRRLVNERARALAAVSHDLRTPLTRLRLRAELIEEASLREQMAADLESMAAMLDATLDYLRGLQEKEAIRKIDMNALLQSLVQDAELLGKSIDLQGTVLIPYTGRLLALRRALQNLIDNAIKYGKSARIVIEDDPAVLTISVNDAGPGIAPEELARVTEPFYRPDASRNSETGGVGLGLSIVKDIAVMHGGELILANTPGTTGLSAKLVLPRCH